MTFVFAARPIAPTGPERTGFVPRSSSRSVSGLISGHYQRLTVGVASTLRMIGAARRARLSAVLALALLLPMTAACQTITFGQKEAAPQPEAPAEKPDEEDLDADAASNEKRIVVPRAVLNEDPFLLDDLAVPNDKPGAQIALLLPLSGQQAEVGQALLEGAQMALFDMRNPAANLIPFDTRGTADGAREAAAKAVQAGADIILGPLLTTSVEAAAPIARQAGINLLSFSNNPAVVGGGVYALGFSPAEQVRTIIDFAVGQGSTRFAVLAPTGPYGELVVQSTQATIATYPARLVSARFIDQDAHDYADLITAISNYDGRRQALLSEQRALASKTDEASKAALRRLEELETLGEPPFDAILLAPTSNTTLRTLAAQLAYYDVDQPAVRILGLQLWDQFPQLHNEPALIGSWYPAPANERLDQFRSRFAQFYGKRPQRLASLGYDAMALCAVLAGDGVNPNYSTATLTNEQGFLGVDGLFRLLPSGVVQRSYAIREITRSGIETIEPARTTFTPLVN